MPKPASCCQCYFVRLQHCLYTCISTFSDRWPASSCRIDNLIYAPDTTDCVLALLDWELSTLGYPLADLAYSAMCYHFPSSDKTAVRGLPTPLPEGTNILAARILHGCYMLAVTCVFDCSCDCCCGISATMLRTPLLPMLPSALWNGKLPVAVGQLYMC